MKAGAAGGRAGPREMPAWEPRGRRTGPALPRLLCERPGPGAAPCPVPVLLGVGSRGCSGRRRSPPPRPPRGRGAVGVRVAGVRPGRGPRASPVSALGRGAQLEVTALGAAPGRALVLGMRPDRSGRGPASHCGRGFWLRPRAPRQRLWGARPVPRAGRGGTERPGPVHSLCIPAGPDNVGWDHEQSRHHGDPHQQQRGCRQPA